MIKIEFIISEYIPEPNDCIMFVPIAGKKERLSGVNNLKSNLSSNEIIKLFTPSMNARGSKLKPESVSIINKAIPVSGIRNNNNASKVSRVAAIPFLKFAFSTRKTICPFNKT